MKFTNKIKDFITEIKNDRKKTILSIAILVMLFIAICTVIILAVNRHEKKENIASGGHASFGNVSLVTEENTEEEKATTKKEETTTKKLKEEETTILETTKKEEETSNNVENESNNNSDVGINTNNQVVNTITGNGALNVSGRNLVDASGNIVQLKGISTHGIAWFPDYINSTCFKQLHEDFNVNVIRLAMYSAEYNGYCSGGDRNYLKDLIDKGVNYATENGMYVIIDWHILSDGDPNTNAIAAREFFDEMSSKYAGYSNVIYEICNEPNGGVSWSQIKSYAIPVIDIIKSHSKDAVIIVGTPTWSQEVDKAVADPITGYSNIMYSLHFYAATHTDSLRRTLANAADSGLPIFVTEFGICDASGNGAIDENQAGAWINLLNQYNISYCMWSLCNKAESASIINSNCSKTSGFSIDDLSQSGKWFLKMMTGELDLSAYKDESTTNTSQTQAPQQQPQSQQQQSVAQPQTQPQTQSTNKNVAVNASLSLVNSWESNGKKYFQYNITVTNNSGSNCSSWYTDIKFNENVILDQSWNGNVTVNGNKIHITSMDYNGNLQNGGKTDNIGIIVAGSTNLKTA